MAARRFQSTTTAKAAETSREAASKATKTAKTAKEAASKATNAAETMAKESTTKASSAAKESASQTSSTAKESVSQASSTAKESASQASSAVKETASSASSTAKESVSKASSTASEYTNKAAQGLTRVASSAGPAIAGAAKGAASSLSKVGGRTGKMVGFIERQVPTVVFYSKVFAELAKMVFRGQKMSPPSISTFQTYYESAIKALQNPSALLQTASRTAQQSGSLLQAARNINKAQVIAGGVLAAECLGFFTVGEMIGRFKIIGYHGENPAAHH
ncbi:hypothetical protein DL766_000671 [Monosporascus sp. MC13-8B]|uniref:Uncharacterized protein n=1 Tax=Monosporascus cannonballus TaxID=155416 RepID=A0ABY0H1Q8_9PEZI|nr:hypothetical protein DL762_006705 [Monosporascus cannonballus]RYO85688.1 hypothetical protein DL763_006991 [Monosporascus cannonballus]RYP39031.1 hypothetical protein DL766_000671 [Monosporascus sp. MC13-8B]